ncbi:MAG TPA: glycoside hydrolase family 15 protein [Solirubrobacteraceae bacterium]|nr:glycoside hydrolase family 15 protein [Solirubrobacteraceae bacterium]
MTARPPNRADGYLPIEDYAAIGDGRTLALVGVDGAIDWLCLPQLDSPSMFGALLDPARGGRFVVQPAVPFTAERSYLERTNVLETTFHTDRGTVTVTDALTIDSSQPAPWRELVRKIETRSGTVPMNWRFEPQFDYGRHTPDLERAKDALVGRHGHLQVALRTFDAGDPQVTGGGAFGTFTAAEDTPAILAVIAANEPTLPIPSRDQIERRLSDTVQVWRSWVARQTYEGPWREAVERSLLSIRLLGDADTGAIAAAGTTSLPEVLAGKRNYDYRFAWVRDLCFTLDALMSVGMDELTQASVQWLLRATRNSHPRVDPVYALDGSVLRSQQSLPLDGYRRTTPVHLGNNAGAQLQLGGFGDLLETMSVYVDHGHLLGPSAGARLADIADLLVHIWRQEDSGLWELGNTAHYGTSKLGAWVAFDRLLELVERGQAPPRHVDRWRQARDQVRDFIETRLFSSERNAYLFKAGSNELDCGLLLAARRGFGPVERIHGTIDAIQAELDADGPLFYRYSGMQDEENAFLACSFWMVEALAITGRLDEAAELMDALIGLGNDVGLYSEEMEPDTHAMRGNFPQALTHLSLINAADAIASRTDALRPPATARAGQVV